MSEMKTSFGSAIQGLAGLESFVRCDIGHGLTESNRNDTARTSSLARSPFDRQNIPPQIEQDGEVDGGRH